MKRFFFVLVALILCISITGCGKSGDALVGKWLKNDPNPSNQVLEIKKNGDSFVVIQTENAPSIGTLNVVTNQFPATIKENNIITIQSGFGPLDLSYVKEDNSILFDRGKYKKMTNEMEQEYSKKQEEIKGQIEKNAPKGNPGKNVERGLL